MQRIIETFKIPITNQSLQQVGLKFFIFEFYAQERFFQKQRRMFCLVGNAKIIRFRRHYIFVIPLTPSQRHLHDRN